MFMRLDFSYDKDPKKFFHLFLLGFSVLCLGVSDERRKLGKTEGEYAAEFCTLQGEPGRLSTDWVTRTLAANHTTWASVCPFVQARPLV